MSRPIPYTLEDIIPPNMTFGEFREVMNRLDNEASAAKSKQREQPQAPDLPPQYT